MTKEDLLELLKKQNERLDMLEKKLEEQKKKKSEKKVEKDFIQELFS